MIQKRIPKIIYKYRSWQETDRYLDEESKFQKRILINSEIFFSNPKDFNDPFDLRIPKRYDKLTIDQKFEMLLYWVRILFPNDSVTEINNKAIKQFEKGYLLDDEYLEKRNNIEIDNLCNTHGVFSVAKNPDNILMWAHYANNHRGFCIGFDSKKLEEYLKKNKSNPDYIYTLFSVNYLKEYPIIIPTVNYQKRFENTITRLCTKGNLWSYEKEFRYILTGATSKAISIDPLIYQEIIFGCKTDPRVKKEITDILNKFYPHIKRFRVEQDKECFRLNLIKE
jgi:hypothetical protein